MFLVKPYLFLVSYGNQIYWLALLGEFGGEPHLLALPPQPQMRPLGVANAEDPIHGRRNLHFGSNARGSGDIAL